MKALLALTLCIGLCGCGDVSMTRQKKYDAYAPSSVWSDGASARPLPEGTVARGDLERDQASERSAAGDPVAAGARPGALSDFLRAVSRSDRRWRRRCRRARISPAAAVRPGAAARGAGAALLRRHQQRLRRDVPLRPARAARRSLGDRRLHTRLAARGGRVGRGGETAMSAAGTMRQPVGPAPFALGVVGCAAADGLDDFHASRRPAGLADRVCDFGGSRRSARSRCCAWRD